MQPADPWSARTGEEPGRGYSAVDLENAARRNVLAEVEQKVPGALAGVVAAIKLERQAREQQKQLRQQIQTAVPGDAVIHVFAAAERELGGVDKNDPRLR